jgi:hypothetical protein
VGVASGAGDRDAMDCRVDLALEIVDSSTLAVMLPRQGSGTWSRASSSRPSTPKRSVTGQGFAKLISVEWTRFLSADCA